MALLNQKTKVLGVKENYVSTYKFGNVNLTAGSFGALLATNGISYSIIDANYDQLYIKGFVIRKNTTINKKVVVNMVIEWSDQVSGTYNVGNVIPTGYRPTSTINLGTVYGLRFKVGYADVIGENTVSIGTSGQVTIVASQPTNYYKLNISTSYTI